jgi:hypothetical protein
MGGCISDDGKNRPMKRLNIFPRTRRRTPTRYDRGVATSDVAVSTQGKARALFRDNLLQPLSIWIWALAATLAAWGIFRPNSWLTAAATLLVPLLVGLLWFRGEPPVLLFACLMQWLQASIAIFYTDFHGVSLRSVGGKQLAIATWLSLGAIFVLAAGMRVAQFRRRRDVAEQAQRETLRLEPGKILTWYLLLFIGIYFVQVLADSLPGLAQPLLAVATLRWVLVFLLAQSVLTLRRGYWLLGVVICIEFVTGILGFFSGFKGVFFVLLVVLPTASFLFKGWRLVQFGFVAALIVTLAIVWTVIKEDYREFLNQGTGQQVILVPASERIAKLGDLVGALNMEAIEEGMEKAVLRISYVSYFAAAITHVPSQIPHENGELWLGAVRHVLMPRFLYPNKPVINDSERVEKYTGIPVAGAEQGTSISLGYMAESYVDFGPVGMFAPVFVLGIFYGLIYRYFVYHYSLRLLGFAMATSILVFGAYTIETSNIKLVGGNAMGFIVSALFAKFFGPSVWNLMTRVNGSPRRRQCVKDQSKPAEQSEVSGRSLK